MTDLNGLIAQREAVEVQIVQAQAAEKADGIQKVRALIADYGLTVEVLALRSTRIMKAVEPSKVAVKYRDKGTGATWSGCGLKPKWMTAKIAAGQKIEPFAVRGVAGSVITTHIEHNARSVLNPSF